MMEAKKPEVRSARPGDLSAIHELAEELREEIGITTPSGADIELVRFETCFQAALSDPHTRILVAEAGGKVVGFLSVWKRPTLSHVGSAALVDDLIVSTTARGQGLGTALIREALRYAQEWGCVEIEVTTTPENQGAQRFYHELGFADRGLLLEQDL